MRNKIEITVKMKLKWNKNKNKNKVNMDTNKIRWIKINKYKIEQI